MVRDLRVVEHEHAGACRARSPSARRPSSRAGFGMNSAVSPWLLPGDVHHHVLGRRGVVVRRRLLIVRRPRRHGGQTKIKASLRLLSSSRSLRTSVACGFPQLALVCGEQLLERFLVDLPVRELCRGSTRSNSLVIVSLSKMRDPLDRAGQGGRTVGYEMPYASAIALREPDARTNRFTNDRSSSLESFMPLHSCGVLIILKYKFQLYFT